MLRVMFTFLYTFSSCYAMRSVMSQINEYDDDDDDDVICQVQRER